MAFETKAYLLGRMKEEEINTISPKGKTVIGEQLFRRKGWKDVGARLGKLRGWGLWVGQRGMGSKGARIEGAFEDSLTHSAVG